MFRRAAYAGLLPGVVIAAVLTAAYFPLMRPVQLGQVRLVCSGFNVGCSAPTITGVSPEFGPPGGGITVTITGTNFNTSPIYVTFGGAMTNAVTVISDTQLTVVVPSSSSSGTVHVAVNTSSGTNATSPTPADQFTYVPVTSYAGCSTRQYTLTGSDGATWRSIDPARTSITVTSGVDSYWVITGNADLWTSSLGYNQDLGIAVVGGTNPVFPTAAGQPEAWKESGGSGGTYSPNAAAVQTVIPVKAGQGYAATLQWKANRPDPGSIWAGAGANIPVDPTADPPFSQTCIIGRLVATSPGPVVTAASTAQYSLANSDGLTWRDMDPANLSPAITAPADGVIFLSGNADLWTATAGINQDIAINVNGTVNVWKEGGGAAGTFSPNAAFVQSVIPVTSGTTYIAKFQWKAHRSAAGNIYSGAGPIGGKFSPTRLTAQFHALGHEALDKVSTSQYSLPNTNFAGLWSAIDSDKLSYSITSSVPCDVIISANVDLWYTNTPAGPIWGSGSPFNQDIGIVVLDLSVRNLPFARPTGWKESGGGGGTFSPNAAYLAILVRLYAGVPYSIYLAWKPNQMTGGTMYAGAGPIAGAYSPTHLTIQPISSC